MSDIRPNQMRRVVTRQELAQRCDNGAVIPMARGTHFLVMSYCNRTNLFVCLHVSGPFYAVESWLNDASIPVLEEN